MSQQRLPPLRAARMRRLAPGSGPGTRLASPAPPPPPPAPPQPAPHPLDQRQWLAICVALIALAPYACACTSRAVPAEPRPTTTTTQPVEPPPPDAITSPTTARPNITFPTFRCPATYDAWYCLNQATCFAVEIHNEVLYNCECAAGYVGPRCEYKEIDGSFFPARQRAILRSASLVSGLALAILMAFVVGMALYIRYEKRQNGEGKLQNGAAAAAAGLANDGADEVDGMTIVPAMRRPFGPHHYKIRTLAEVVQLR